MSIEEMLARVKEFQVLIGSLVTVSSVSDADYLYTFQVLIGSLVTSGWNDSYAFRTEFQVLIGSLVTCCCSVSCHRPSVVSSPYR